MKLFDMSGLPPAKVPVVEDSRSGSSEGDPATKIGMDGRAIRRLLVDMLTDMQETISKAHQYCEAGVTPTWLRSRQYHDAGVIRGLLWTLNGKDPGQVCIRNSGTILAAAGIPFETDPDTDEVFIPNSWLIDHGLDPEKD